MSNAARKARKKAGVKFTRTPKTPTPIELRAVSASGSRKRPGQPSRRGIARATEWSQTLLRGGVWSRRVKASEVD